jgi:uncharacterized protein YjfI (DUF2170 family)
MKKMLNLKKLENLTISMIIGEENLLINMMKEEENLTIYMMKEEENLIICMMKEEERKKNQIRKENIMLLNLQKKKYDKLQVYQLENHQEYKNLMSIIIIMHILVAKIKR